MKTLKIVAIIADDKAVTLYKDDGTAIEIKQRNIQSPDVLVQAYKDIKKKGYAEVSYDFNHKEDEYSLYEKRSGLVKFFKVAKSFVTNLFKEPDETLETQKEEKPAQHEKEQASRERHVKAIQELTEVVNSDESETIAIVDNTVIPNVDKLEKMVTHSNKLNHYKGFDKFMQRAAAMIHTRKHTVADLITFLERSDLHIMDDGAILAYKRVESKNSVYVDSYTKKVTQWVGCKVFMAPNMVDENRRTECSQGLHVCRRSYLSRFCGDTILLTKVEPEDFIAVPHKDANKVRVSGYHILAKVSQDDFRNLVSNLPMKDTELLSQLLAGNHTPVTDTVEITGEQGTGLVIKKVQHEKAVQTASVTPQQPIATEEDDKEADAVSAPVINPKELMKETVDEPTKSEDSQDENGYPVTEEIKETGESLSIQIDESKDKEILLVSEKTPKPKKTSSTKKVKKMTAAERLQKLVPIKNMSDAMEAYDIKVRNKKSWEKLGLTKAQGEDIMKWVKANK